MAEMLTINEELEAQEIEAHNYAIKHIVTMLNDLEIEEQKLVERLDTIDIFRNALYELEDTSSLTYKDVQAVINKYAAPGTSITLRQPGNILLGSTSLSEWKNGGDSTIINGGTIAHASYPR